MAEALTRVLLAAALLTVGASAALASGDSPLGLNEVVAVVIEVNPQIRGARLALGIGAASDNPELHARRSAVLVLESG